MKLDEKARCSCRNIAIAMLPALAVGYALHGFIKGYLFSTGTVIAGLIIGGIFMMAAEKFHRPFAVKDVDLITGRQAFQIGLFQCLSLWLVFHGAAVLSQEDFYWEYPGRLLLTFLLLWRCPDVYCLCI